MIGTDARGLSERSMTVSRRSHLGHLEFESIFVMREVAAQFERPVLLFSGGKDSILVPRARRRTHLRPPFARRPR